MQVRRSKYSLLLLLVHWWELREVPSHSKPYFFLHRLLIWPPCGDVLTGGCVMNWVWFSFQMIQTCHITWQLVSGIINEPDNTCDNPLFILKVLFWIKQSYFDGFVQNQSYFASLFQIKQSYFVSFVLNQAFLFRWLCSRSGSLILMVLFRIKRSYFDCFVQIQAVLLCQFVPNQEVLFCQFCSESSILISMSLF